MSLIEGIGDEVTNFIIILGTILVAYFAWRSTYVEETTLAGRSAVLLIENNRRRLAQAQHPVTISILRSASRQSNVSNVTEEVEFEEDSSLNAEAQESENPERDLETDANEQATTVEQASPTEPVSDNSVVDTGPQEILRNMDEDILLASDGLRRRRNDASQSESKTDSCVNVTKESLTQAPSVVKEPKQNEIRIKLKYLNDELKLVRGYPLEAVGDFKKRNFVVELADHKLVRLVFNGHLLQPDTKSLQACGLFDNCVVHCLVHANRQQVGGAANPPNASVEVANDDEQTIIDGSNGRQASQQLNSVLRVVRPEATQQNEHMYMYLGLILFTISLLTCWFYRINYNNLFTWYSTIVLVFISALFILLMPFVIIIDHRYRIRL